MPIPAIIAGVIAIIVIGIIIIIQRKKKKNSEGENVVTIKPDNSGRPLIKKALLVGINKYKPELNANLQGCVNDVENIHKLLIDNFKFDPENIRSLVDARATKQGILDRLKWLLDGAKAGDELVFHYSGHGCFSGDTEIKLLDGTTKTMSELEQNYRDDVFWVYSCTENGEIVPGKAHSPRITKTSKVIKVILDNDEFITCTEDHLFMLRDGTYKPACKLVKNDSLMPLYTKKSKKSDGDRLDEYELVYIPNTKNIPNKLLYSNDNYFYTHQIVGYYTDMLSGGYKGVLHHKDFNKLNNAPTNLELLTRNKHAKLHAQTKEHKEKSKQNIINYNKNIFPERIRENNEFRLKFGKASSKARKKDWQSKAYRNKIVVGLKASYENSGEEDPRIQALHNNRWKSHTQESRKKAVISFKITTSDKNSAFYKAGHSIQRKVQLVQANKIANHTRWHINRGIINENCGLCNQPIKNHKVVEVEYLNIEIPVYDITVEKYHNFALKAGVFVHNSQIRDRDGDELEDQLDEILCPHDLDWDDPLTDDYLGDLFKQLPKGVYLTMICDSCHSGSISRSMSKIYHNRSKSILPPFDIGSRSFNKILPRNSMGKKDKGAQGHLLISGCKDNQTSADAYIDGRYQGALTWALTTVIRKNPGIQWDQAHKEVLVLLSNYSQEPQLSGNATVVFRKVFGG